MRAGRCAPGVRGGANPAAAARAVLFDVFDRDGARFGVPRARWHCGIVPARAGSGGIDSEEFEFLFSAVASLGSYKGNIQRARTDWDM